MTQPPRENVQSYPRPPALEPVAERITIHLQGLLVADTCRAFRVLETHHAPSYYLPPEDIGAVVHPVAGTSFCEWKGVADYFDVQVGAHRVTRAAWSYAHPDPGFVRIAGYLAFYAGKFDEIMVGPMRVVPQPGDFYGGWVTPNLDGQIKGAPGTRHW